MIENDVFGKDINIFAEKLLENGYYPENLPPVFAIKNFYAASLPHLTSNDYLSEKPSEPVTYNASKRGGSRRIFSMPNPCFMIDCARFFHSHRSPIFELFQSTNDSLSVPKFSESGRPVRIGSHADFHRDRREKLATSRFIVKTDISRYYHSIYTHSLPWAINGKAEAKKDRKVDSSIVFGNRLDQIVRQSQDGQTVGIPVGPDFSRYISEIIGKAIDLKFRQMHGDQFVFIRHVDDIFIGADDHDQATQLLNGIRDTIRKFQLDVNDSKTHILPTNRDLEPFWPVRIRREIEGFSGKDPKSSGAFGHDFVYFLDEVIRIANEENDDGVIKYTLRKMDEYELWNDYWNLAEPFLVRAAINFPHCWDFVSTIASWRHRTSGLDIKLWTDVVVKSLIQHSKSGNDSEVCWALWLAKEANLQIPLSAIDSIISRCGALSVLLAIDVYQANKHTFSFPKANLLDRLGDRPMLGENWVLSYEADRQFGFSLKTRNLIGSSFFSELYNSSSEFYDASAVPSAFTNIADPKEVSSALDNITSYYDEDFAEEEIEVSISDPDF